MSHNWSAMKQHLHPQSVAEISRHSVLSADRIRQCETSSGSRNKDTDQFLNSTKKLFSATRGDHEELKTEEGSITGNWLQQSSNFERNWITSLVSSQ